jgi:cyclic beta-1,2-glucan synthetase
MGSGDWNDGMNLVGARQGRERLAGWFMAEVMQGMAEMADHFGQPTLRRCLS